MGFSEEKKSAKCHSDGRLSDGSRPPPNVERWIRGLSATATAAPRGSRAFHPPEINQGLLKNLTVVSLHRFIMIHLAADWENEAS